MSNRKFVLKPKTKETVNKSIKFPVDLICRIEKIIAEKDVSFSSFVKQACEYALENEE